MGAFGLTFDILLSLLLIFISRDWIVDAYKIDALNFIAWSAAMMIAGAGVGWGFCSIYLRSSTKDGDKPSKDSGELSKLTYYDLSRRQRSILASLRDGDSSTLRCDGHVRDLVAQGLIACADGYDLDDRAETYEFVLTSKGNRVLNCHPIASMVAKRRANNG